MQPSSTPRASTYYEIRVAHEPTPARVFWVRNVWTYLFARVIAPASGFLPYDYEPKHECHVVVRRRADDRVVVSYDHNQLTDALSHAHSLRERAEQLSIVDFDRDLGLRSAW